MKKINKIFFALLLVFFVVSCGPQKRLNRLHKKHSYLFKTENLYIRDTVIFKEHIKDTIFNVIFDTIRVSDNKHEIILIKKDSLIYLHSHIFADTVYFEKIVEVDKAQITKQNNFDSLFKYILGFLCLLLLFIIVAVVRK